MAWKLHIACLILFALTGCSGLADLVPNGREIGLNHFGTAKPTEYFSTMEPSLYSTDDVGRVIKALIANYQIYGALFNAVEKESPTVENECYELADKVRKVKYLLRQQFDLLVHAHRLNKKLETLKKGDPEIENAVMAGNLFFAKAEQRIRKHDELMEIIYSFTYDCPSVPAVMFVLPALVGLQKAVAKAPAFNATAYELEMLSEEEKKLASSVVQSLRKLR